MKPRKRIPRKLKEQVKAKFDYRCAYCGTKPKRIHIDHLVPHEFSGDDSPENLMPSCPQCNNYKNVLSLEAFRDNIQDSIRKARERSVNFRFAEKYGLIEVKDEPVKFYFEQDNCLK